MSLWRENASAQAPEGTSRVNAVTDQMTNSEAIAAGLSPDTSK